MIQSFDFGKTANGTRVTRFRLKNASGAYADVLDFGCTVQAFAVRDQNGKNRDVVAGFDSVAGYENSLSHMGAVCARVANRIAGAKFTLEGREYRLIDNDGGNCLHGGGRGFSFGVWHAETDGDRRLCLSRTSPDGEYGFPGTLRAEVAYELTNAGALEITYRAACDKPTLYNPTNHCYFMLDDEPNVYDTILWIASDRFLETDAALIPTGKIVRAAGTPMDFAKEKPIGRDIAGTPAGYDHCFLLNGEGMRLAARARSDKSGLTLEVWTDRPAIQLYTANFLDEENGKGGRAYKKQSSFCLETQTCPDAVHHPDFPTMTLLPGADFVSKTSYLLK